MKKIAAALIASIGFSFAFPVLAQSYPNKPIRLVVPLSPGGSADVLGRLLAQKLTEKYGQTVVVDNRPGVGGNIGAEFVAHSPADGYTLLFGTMGIHATSQVYPKLSYNPQTELKTVVVLAAMPNVLVVAKNVDSKDTQSIIKDSIARPDSLFFGSAGYGSSTHMAGELFKYDSGAKIAHVPYKGSGPALTDLVAGRLQMMFENLPTALPLINSGAIRAVAVTGSNRASSLPNVPTIREDGLSNYVFTAWFTIAAPAGTPNDIVTRLNRDIREIMNSPALQARLNEMGVTPGNQDVAATQAFIAAEAAKFGKVIKEARIVAQ